MSVIKKLFFIGFGILLTSIVFAQEIINTNKIFSVNSQEYENCKSLCIMTNKAMPSSAGPWSADELIKTLEKLNYSELSPSLKDLYDKTYASLSSEGSWIIDKGLKSKVGFETNIELYAHTNPDDFGLEKYWVKGFEQRKSFISANWEAWVINFLYSYTEVNFENSSCIFANTENDILYASNFVTNIPFIPPCSTTNINGVFPNRAFLSTGLSNWNISFGRDIIRWGNGESGNLLLGGNNLYDNYFNATTYFTNFKYTFLTILYPHDSNTSTSQNDIFEGTKAFIAHRIEARFFQDKLSLALAESIMYQSYDNSLSTIILNPAAIFHNYYIRGNSNSIFYLESDYSICKNLNVYLQLVSDDLATPGEPDATKGEGGNPNAFGYLLGLKFNFPAEKGYFHSSLEGVYTDTYLYLREPYNSTTKQYGVSYYSSFREFCNSLGATYLNQCIGYKYGGDCIVANINFGYQSLSNWKIDTEFFYMAHGIVNSDTQWKYYEEGIIAPSTPSTSCPVGTGVHEGFVEHIFRYSIFSDYSILKCLSCSARLDFWWINNQNNQNKDTVFDTQFCIGFTYKI